MENNKLSVNYLKELFYFEVKRLFTIQDKIKDSKWKYELLRNLIEQLNNSSLEDIYNNRLIICMQLETIFENSDIYIDKFLSSLMKSINEKNKHLFFSEFVSKLNLRKLKLEVEMDLDKSNDFSVIPLYIRINKKLKFRQFIDEKELKIIASFLKNKKFDSLEIVKLCEKINVYNNSLHKPKVSTSEKFAVLNILNIGYEKFPNIILSMEKNNQINTLVNNLYEMSKEFIKDLEVVKLQLPKFDSNIYSDKEYLKIYYDYMKKLQLEIYDLIDLFKDENFYFDEESKNLILNEYGELMNLYYSVQDFFESQLSQKNEEIINIEEKQLDNQPKVHILFSMADNNSYLENDLKNIPEEYYDKIKNLLLKKEYGILSPNEDKQLLNHKRFKQYRELRHDQVRIVYRNIGNDSIIVLGAGVKKSDNDKVLYSRCCSRPITVELDNFNEELRTANTTFERIQVYCAEKSRKGTR